MMAISNNNKRVVKIKPISLSKYSPHPPFGRPRIKCGAGSLPKGEANKRIMKQHLLWRSEKI
jgi:hypothetical protein